jgi:hypothetical protein
MATISSKIGKLALLWRGDQDARREATPESNRFHHVFAALTARGISAEPAVYSEEAEKEIREQLLQAAGVLVWVNPLSDGLDRQKLDAMLREVASRGTWVSTHPDVTLKMGVKEILFTTKHLGWGTDTHLYLDVVPFREALPRQLRSGPRVIKQNRGNGGQGVWKVEQNGSNVSVLEARHGSEPQTLPLDDFMKCCESYFLGGGRIIDQPFQERLPDGMIRCYMGTDKVVGFGHQFIKALMPPPPEGVGSPAAQPGPRIMHPASAPEFQTLRTKMEHEWAPQMVQLLGIDRESMPIIWDADFLYGPRDAAGNDTFVLCEINVSSVFPIPDQAPDEIARLAHERLLALKPAPDMASGRSTKSRSLDPGL